MIARLAARQHGIVARHQLVAAGVSEGLVKHWLGVGRLLPVFRGVYAVGRPADGYRSVWMAATLCAGPGAVLSGRSAAAAHGILKPERRIEVCRPAGRLRRLSGVRPHQRFRLVISTSPLIDGDWVRVGPVTVMSVSRLMIELAGSLNKRQLRRAFIEAGRLDLLSPACLNRCESRSISFKGRSELIGLIGFWTGGSGKVRSGLEGDFRLLCGEHGIPHPLRNQQVCGREFDCLWPEARLVVELDSRRFHDDGFGFENDREKGNRLTMAGYRLIRLTHQRIKNEPVAVAAEILLMLRRTAASEPVGN